MMGGGGVWGVGGDGEISKYSPHKPKNNNLSILRILIHEIQKRNGV